MPESESERVERIQDAQINARDRGGLKQSRPNPNAKSSRSNTSAKKPAARIVPKIALPKIVRANTRANAIHDVLVGLAFGAIPALLALVFLSGGFKVLGFVILLAAGGVGYLLGETAA